MKGWTGEKMYAVLTVIWFAASALVTKNAPSPSWSEKSRRIRLGLENRAVSALVWKVAPYPSESVMRIHTHTCVSVCVCVCVCVCVYFHKRFRMECKMQKVKAVLILQTIFDLEILKSLCS